MSKLRYIMLNTVVKFNFSLVPRPFERWRRKKGLVHIACACAGGPQKKKKTGVIGYYYPFIIHITARHAKPAKDHYGNATGRYRDPSACARSVYQTLLSPPPSLGTRLIMNVNMAVHFSRYLPDF